mmetsp:Transcript_56979/g.69615  ORF Transcript_56979/g.69615 Transcript_56979/m.69615 type:complete len:162 (+) Transcript_56979:157-642(+)
MSLVPFLYDINRPTFHNFMDDAMREMADFERHRSNAIKPYWIDRRLRDTHMLAKSSGDVIDDEKKFEVSMEVCNFRPDELKVTMGDNNTLVIEGKHEEKTDEHGKIQRHFIRKYTLPKTVQVNAIKSELSSEGLLTITAPKGNASESRNIPIMAAPKKSDK